MRTLLYIWWVIAFLTVSGCVADKNSFLPGIGTGSLAVEHRERALSLEEQGELPQAIFSWQVVRSLHPQDAEAQAKIESLRSLAMRQAEEHYKKALDLLQAGELDEARLQAVIALRYDPNRLEPLALIQQDRYMVQHQVRPGENLKTIANKYFGDPSMARIIAFFNDLPSDTTPVIAGMLLKFPHLPQSEKAEPPITSPEMEALLAEVREEFKQKKYQKVVDLAAKVLKENPSQQEAQFFVNKSYLAIGSIHLQKGEYSQADNVLVHVADDFPGLKETQSELNSQKRKQAEEHYRKGMKFYLNENLSEAIKEWQQALQLDPEHVRAQQNIKKARNISERLKNVK